MNYKKMYLSLFNAISTATQQILQNDSPAALKTLLDAQAKTEEMYIEKDAAK